MALIWTGALSTGVDEIDNQHKELFSRINKLFEACDQGKGKEEVAEVFQFLNDYVIEHFGTEEKYMVQYNYSDYTLHKAEHGKFIAGFSELKNKFAKEGKNLYITISTNRFLTEWLINHISKVDKAMALFLKTEI